MVGGYHFILQGEMDEQETNRFSILPGDPKQASKQASKQWCGYESGIPVLGASPTIK